MAQQTRNPNKDELFPESATDFFLIKVDIQLKSAKDVQGKVTGIVLRQGRTRNTCSKD